MTSFISGTVNLSRVSITGNTLLGQNGLRDISGCAGIYLKDVAYFTMSSNTAAWCNSANNGSAYEACILIDGASAYGTVTANITTGVSTTLKIASTCDKILAVGNLVSGSIGNSNTTDNSSEIGNVADIAITNLNY